MHGNAAKTRVPERQNCQRRRRLGLLVQAFSLHLAWLTIGSPHTDSDGKDSQCKIDARARFRLGAGTDSTPSSLVAAGSPQVDSLPVDPAVVCGCGSIEDFDCEAEDCY